MKLKHYLRLAYESFINKFLKGYFSTFNIIKGLGIAIILSFFIYSAYLGYSSKLLNTILGLLCIYLLLSCKQKILSWSGFFVGIFWFYWIALSFKYYGFVYMEPLIMLLIAAVYFLFFWILSYPKNPFIRAVLLLFASYVHPFEFSWFKPELIFTQSYIGIQKWQFAIVLFAISSFVYLYKNREMKPLYFLILAPTVFAFQPQINIQKPPFSIYLYDQKLPQDIKWNPRYTNQIISKNFQAINRAINENKKMIILNESAFPLFLNRKKELLKRLKNLSKKIIIVTGALRADKDSFYNSTYYFINGKIKIADKVVLVPFGEKIPLPNFLVKIINRLFFDGASDFKTAKEPTVIDINGIKFTNAICYEATEDIIYKKHTPFVIAVSNNAWFTPSIEPTLQNILIRFYAKKYNTTIIHAANMGISGIF